MANKKWNYHKSHSFVFGKEKTKISFLTQLYRIGVYGIMNNDAASQGNFTPA